MHIGSEPEADPVAVAHEMISLLRSVRTPGGAVSAAAPGEITLGPATGLMRRGSRSGARALGHPPGPLG
jgi:hypothetical protein